MNRPSEGAMLILLDMYQRSKAATEEELIQTVIPDNIRNKLFQFTLKYDIHFGQYKD